MDRWSVLPQDTLLQKYPGTTVNHDTHGTIQMWLLDLILKKEKPQLHWVLFIYLFLLSRDEFFQFEFQFVSDSVTAVLFGRSLVTE